MYLGPGHTVRPNVPLRPYRHTDSSTTTDMEVKKKYRVPHHSSYTHKKKKKLFKVYLGPGRTEYPSAPLRPQRHTDFSTIKYV